MPAGRRRAKRDGRPRLRRLLVRRARLLRELAELVEIMLDCLAIPMNVGPLARVSLVDEERE